jgi:hypothetical protein
MTDTTEPAAPLEPGVPDTGHGAVIAIPGRKDEIKGRYLHHAPGPAATATLLLELFRVRYRGRDGYTRAIRELINDHPSGWQRLGTRATRSPEVKPRRAPAPAGTCYCHLDDGSLHPEVIRAALHTMHRAEATSGDYDQRSVHVPHGRPGDGSPWLMRTHDIPRHLDHVYVLYRTHLDIHVRDGAYPKTNKFVSATGLSWREPFDPDQVERECAAVRERTVADRANENAADALANTVRRLAEIPAHHDLVLHLLRRDSAYYNVPAENTPEAALARAAGIDPADLPAHLRTLERPAQLDLLRAAAHQLNPAAYRAP